MSSTMSLNMNIELKKYLTFSKLLQKHLNQYNIKIPK